MISIVQAFEKGGCCLRRVCSKRSPQTKASCIMSQGRSEERLGNLEKAKATEDGPSCQGNFLS